MSILRWAPRSPSARTITVTEQQTAIIAVTHDEKIFNRFDRIFQLRDGRLEWDERIGRAA